jgi:hypothetical protein
MLLTGEKIQAEVTEGLWRAAGPRLLLKALWETDALQSPIMEGEQIARIHKRAGEAVAFVVIDVGPLVPAGYCEAGDVVLHNSAAGDPVDHHDETCPFWTVHFEDVTAVRKR